MKTVNYDQIMAWCPCSVNYPPFRVKKLLNGRESLSVDDILVLDISDQDKLWALLHDEFIPINSRRELGCQYAERALLREREKGREPDQRSFAGIEAMRKWI